MQPCDSATTHDGWAVRFRHCITLRETQSFLILLYTLSPHSVKVKGARRAVVISTTGLWNPTEIPNSEPNLSPEPVAYHALPLPCVARYG